MSSAAVAPRLRGLGMRNWTIWLGISLATSGAFAVWYKINVMEKRKQGYIDFYKNYDERKEFEAIKKAGLFKGFEWTD